jgi:hypothetical protein
VDRPVHAVPELLREWQGEAVVAGLERVAEILARLIGLEGQREGHGGCAGGTAKVDVDLDGGRGGVRIPGPAREPLAAGLIDLAHRRLVGRGFRQALDQLEGGHVRRS